MPARPAVTFTVLGHNEEELLAVALGQARDALQPGDRLWFLDGQSTDASADVARAEGAEVVGVPLGKGRAVKLALARADTPYLCLLDGDIAESENNIPLTLANGLAEDPADMLVGEFGWPGRKGWHSQRALYEPMARALFPDSIEPVGTMPYSGFRVVRRDLDFGELPQGFGIEAHLNTIGTARRWRIRPVKLGVYVGPERRKPKLGWEIGTAILDVAELEGRIDAELRAEWDDWVAGVMEVLEMQPGQDEQSSDYAERLEAVKRRPVPPRLPLPRASAVRVRPG